MPRTSDSLHGLLLRRLWFPLLLLMLAGAVVSFGLARHYVEQVHDRWLLDSAMSVTQVLRVEHAHGPLRMSEASLRMFEWDTLDRVVIDAIDARGTRLFGTAVVPPPREQAAAMPTYYDAQVDGLPMRVVQVRWAPGRDQPAVTLRVGETLRKRHRLVRQLLLASIPLQASVLMLAAGVVWSGVGAAARVANRAAQDISRMDMHDLRAAAPMPAPAAPRELLPAVRAFQALLRRLADAQAAQQRFVANAAHQLRTPLAAMQVQLERALREPPGEAQRLALEDVSGGLARLRHVAHQILMLNRSEADDAPALALVPLDLAQLARGWLEQHAGAAIDAGVDLGYDGPDDGAWIRGEAQLLGELIANLVDNALRYGRARGAVTVSVTHAGDGVLLRVDDDGPGIAEEARARVVERFQRGTSDGDGCGLGLAIVREISARHAADFAILTSPDGGARMQVRLPAWPAPQNEAVAAPPSSRR